MPHRATRPGLRWVLLPHPSQFSFVVAKYLNCAHTNKHIRAFAHVLTPTRLLGMRTSAMNSVFGTRLFPHVGQPLPPHLNPLFTHFNYFLTGMFSSCNQKKNQPFFPSSQETKTNLMEKQFFLFISFFQIQGTMSINIPICLSVSTPRYSVRTSRHISYWTVCSYATPPSLHLSCLYFNTVKRSVRFG